MIYKRITVERIEKAIGKPLRPILVDLLNKTKSREKTAEKLVEMSGIKGINYHTIYYLEMKLLIIEERNLEVKYK